MGQPLTCRSSETGRQTITCHRIREATYRSKEQSACALGQTTRQQRKNRAQICNRWPPVSISNPRHKFPCRRRRIYTGNRNMASHWFLSFIAVVDLSPCTCEKKLYESIRRYSNSNSKSRNSIKNQSECHNRGHMR